MQSASKDLSLWYSIHGEEYKGDEPAFFDSRELEWVGTLKRFFPQIRESLGPLMDDESKELKPYFDNALQFPPKNWKTIGFCSWGKKNRDNLRRFPAIEEILSEIPGLVTASFNMLEPGSHIKPHVGETNAVYRAHMGISIPAQLPDCGFIVKGESRPWKEGEVLVFLDAHVHEAFNNTAQRRYVLLFDVMRPEFAHKEREVCIKALSLLSLYFFIAHIPCFPIAWLHDHGRCLPRWLIDWVILMPFKLIWRIWWPLRNGWGRGK